MAKERILIVDDEEETVELICRFLTKRGFIAKGANNGEEAIDILENFNPSFIILDIIMPKMDGFQFLRYLKSNLSYSNIPVIMLTAKDTPLDLDKGITEGVDFYLPKPFSLRNLMGYVELIIENKKYPPQGA